MINAVAYLRISEDRTGQAAGVTRQREDAERRARERGWHLTAVESDNDQSAAAGKRKRPGFEAMLKRVAAGEAQAIIAWSLDRLQRNRADEVRLYELCKDKGVTISLINGADLDFTTAGGRLVADQLSSVARYEIELKSDRQKAAQAQAAKAGRRVGGRRPFGYEQDGVTVRQEEADAVYAGYRAVLHDAATLADVARLWNDKGLLTGQGRPFTRSSVKDVLLNPRNAGFRAHVTVDDRRAAGGRRVDKTARVVCQAAWPEIVDEGTWRAAVDLLTDPARRTAPANARALLTGVAQCSECGQTLHGGGATKGQGRVMRCPTGRHINRSAPPVEEYVTAVVLERLARPDAIGLLIDTDRPDAGKLREEAVALRVRLDTFALDYADGVMTREQFRTATERARGRLAEVERHMADSGRADVLGPLLRAEDVEAAWGELSVARRRDVIDLLMTITVFPPGRGTRTFRPELVQIDWRTS